MRSLFLSEIRCISNLMHEKWGVGLHSEPFVIKERLSEPLRATRRPNFNSDFTLDFVEDFTEWPEREGTMNTVLPNTFGSDLYLFVDKVTFRPLHFELMFGDAFSIKYYASYIARVEEVVQDAVLSQQGAGPPHSRHSKEQAISKQSREELLRRLKFKKSASARVLIVGGDICFLCFPSEAVPVMRGSRFDLAQNDDRHIAYYSEGNEIVCFDGWIRTEVATSERVLTSLPEHAP